MPSKVKGQQPEATKAQEGHEIVSPRDHASGLPTGKRMHKPMAFADNVGPTASQQAFDGAGTGGSEMGNLEMQRNMDRRNKAEESASNVMHETSETSEDITDNMK